MIDGWEPGSPAVREVIRERGPGPVNIGTNDQTVIGCALMVDLDLQNVTGLDGRRLGALCCTWLGEHGQSENSGQRGTPGHPWRGIAIPEECYQRRPTVAPIWMVTRLAWL